VELSREIVSDTTLPVLDFSVEDLLAEVAGSWTGNIQVNQVGLPIELNFQLGAGDIFVVTTHWSGNSNSDNGGGGLGSFPMDNDEESCQPYYILPLQADVLSGSLLQESVALEASAKNLQSLEFEGIIAPEDVEGQVVPDFDPTHYDDHHLGVTGNLIDGSLRGFVLWRGTNEAPPPPEEQEPCELSPGISGCFNEETNECGACVGTTGRPGIVDFVGHYVTAR
jgi:hypothetical protein